MKKIISILLASVMMMGVLTACSGGDSKTEKATYTSEELEAIMVAARNEEDNTYNVPMLIGTEDAENLYNFLGFTKENYASGAVAISMMNVKAYGVAVVQAAEGQSEAALAELQAFVDRTTKSFENYLVDQYEIAQNTILEVLDNDVIVMVMCEDSQAVYEKIVSELK